MSAPPLQTVLRRGASLALVGAVAAWPLPAGSAAHQAHADAAEDERKLATRITVTAGALTVERLAAEVSRQTGLTVYADEAIAPHRLTVAVDGVPARALLDAVCALNDWRWNRAEAGKYIIGRKRATPVKDAARIPAGLRAVLPADLRAFVGIDAPLGDAASAAPQASPTRYGQLATAARGRLVGAARRAHAEGKDLAWKDLTPDQQEDIVAVLAANILAPVDAEIWLGVGAGLHVVSAARTVLELQQGQMLMVWGLDASGRRTPGFGANVLVGQDGRPRDW